MKTRERILVTSLEMFNEEGESNVSTNHIADEMDISPGNLYYHFRNKEAIILELFDLYRKEMETLLLAPESRTLDMEDMWFFLHLIFECIWRYRFIYRNQVDLTERIRSIRIHFNHILRQKQVAAKLVCMGLVQSGVMRASEEELDALAANITVIATYWLNYSSVREKFLSESESDDPLAPAVFQVMALVAPFLGEVERAHLMHLGRAYINED